MSDKPHKGRICSYEIVPYHYQGKDYELVFGMFMDHPQFATKRGHTSYIVKRDGNEIETRNSRYTLVDD